MIRPQSIWIFSLCLAAWAQDNKNKPKKNPFQDQINRAIDNGTAFLKEKVNPTA